MNCTESQALLSDLLDDELATDARVNLEAHVGVCAACKKRYRALRRTVRFVKSNAPVEIRPGTNAAGYARFTRALVDDDYNKTPIEVLMEEAAACLTHKEERS